MTRRRRRDRVYWRAERGGWYADFRDFADVGGRIQALIPPGRRQATTDRDEAGRLATERLQQLERLRAGLGGEVPTLMEYSKRHLALKAQSRRPGTIERDALSIENLLGYFGDDVRLTAITVGRLSDYVQHRARQPGRVHATLISAQTIRHELHALSSVFRRALAEGLVVENPVTRMGDKPVIRRPEAAWLESGEAARLVTACFELAASDTSRCHAFLGELVATFLYTGGRRREILGLEASDIDWQNNAIHIRPNRWRELKKTGHRRWVPLWPELRRILKAYLDARPRQNLLFPSRTGAMLHDLRKGLAEACAAAKITTPVTLHTFRHTYAATRLQTLDHGAPVSPYTVMRELGHTSLVLIERTYGHLLNTRHRMPVVAYREAKVIEMEERHGSA